MYFYPFEIALTVCLFSFFQAFYTYAVDEWFESETIGYSFILFLLTGFTTFGMFIAWL